MAGLIVRVPMSSGLSNAAYRAVIVLIWALVVINSAICRGLYWDGASFLASLLDFRTIFDFYPARANVNWVTQVPVLLLADAGVHDTRWLAIAYSAILFAVPTALYHFALARARAHGEPVLVAAVMTIVAAVYLPTSFFIVGEYNCAYATATAAMIVVLTGESRSRRDGAILYLLGVFCVASYEAMIYLGPLLAAAILWSMRRARDDSRADGEAVDDIARLLRWIAALAFLAATAVALNAIIYYWNQSHFTQVRAASLDFWQNLQFVIPFAGLAGLVVVSLIRPRWLTGWLPFAILGSFGAMLAVTPMLRWLNSSTVLFAPSHYVARTAAGWLLGAILIALWLHVGWRRRTPVLLVELRRPEVGRRLTIAAAALLFGATVPDLALSRLWVGYLDYFRGVVVGHTGVVRAEDLPMKQWPYHLFSQSWTYPALSALVRSAPGQGVVVIAKDYKSNPMYEPVCGTVPRLEGFNWR